MAFARKHFRYRTYTKQPNDCSFFIYFIPPLIHLLFHWIHSNGSQWMKWLCKFESSELVQKSIDCQIKEKTAKRSKRRARKKHNLVESSPQVHIIIYQSNAEFWQFTFKIYCTVYADTVARYIKTQFWASTLSLQRIHKVETIYGSKEEEKKLFGKLVVLCLSGKCSARNEGTRTSSVAENEKKVWKTKWDWNKVFPANKYRVMGFFFHFAVCHF